MPFLAALAPVVAGAAAAGTATTALGVAAGVATAAAGAASLVGSALKGGTSADQQIAPNQIGSQGDLTAVGGQQKREADWNAENAIEQQQKFVNQVQANNGLQNQQGVFNSLGQVAAGQGPNPAQAMLAQATGNNVSNQAALMAGQRGASQNVGMIARQAGQQGAQIQQQAVGQGATLQANQSLNALNSMGNIAGQQVNTQQNAMNALQQGSLQQQGQANQAIAAQNNARVSAQNSGNELNTKMNMQNAANNRELLGGAASGIAAAAPVLQKAFDGSGAKDMTPVNSGQTADFNSIPQMGAEIMQLNAAHGGQIDLKAGGKVGGEAAVKGDSLKNDTVPAMLSPKEIVIPRSIAMHPNAPEMAAEFVRQTLAKSSHGKNNYYSGGVTNEPSGEGEAPAMPAPQESAQDVAADITPPPGPVGNMPQGQMTQAPSVEGALNAAQTPAPAPGIAPTDPYTAPYQAAFAQQEKGIQNQAAAEGALGKKQAVIRENAQAEMQNQYQSYLKQKGALDTEIQNMRKDIAGGKIDPQRYVGSMSTGEKLSTAFGLILGGMGGAITGHGGNPALEYMNKQIDHDIDAQKADLGRKENLLSTNLKQYGEIGQAMQMTRAMMIDMASMGLQAEAEKAQDPIQKARAMQGVGQLEKQKQDILGPLALKQIVYKQAQTGGDDPSRLINMLPPHDQAKARDELAKASKAAAAKEAALKSFELVAESKTPQYAMDNPRRAFSGTQSKQLTAAIAELNKTLTGRFNIEENKQLQKQFEPTRLDSDEDIALKREQLMKYMSIDEHSYPTLKQHGIDVQKFRTTSGDPYMRLDAKQKSYVDWAKANPNDPKAEIVLKKLGIR